MKKEMVRKGIILLLLLASVLIYVNSNKRDEGLRVISWEENIYNENNIKMYYEPIKDDIVDKRLISLEKTYKLNELTLMEIEELEKVLKIVDVLNSIVSLDGVNSSLYYNGYDILKSIGERKKVSERDMAIIARDLIQSIGYEARVGEFRKETPQFKTDTRYYVVEYWSPSNNKWIMIDYKSRGYILGESTEPLSAGEVLTNKVKDMKYIGKGKEKQYFNQFKEYLYSYTIAIDNTLDSKRSNSFLTLITSDKAIDMKVNEVEFAPPTVYTKSTEIFEQSPWNYETLEDEKGYIILKKKNISKELTDEEKIEGENTFVIGAFANSSIINKYYLSINGNSFEEVDSYKEITFSKGVNSIELSLDGKIACSKIEIIRDK